MEKIVETDIEFHDLLYHAARNNRLVGIISHVGELRDKIDRQLIVTKDKHGSGSRVEIVT